MVRLRVQPWSEAEQKWQKKNGVQTHAVPYYRYLMPTCTVQSYASIYLNHMCSKEEYKPRRSMYRRPSILFSLQDLLFTFYNYPHKTGSFSKQKKSIKDLHQVDPSSRLLLIKLVTIGQLERHSKGINFGYVIHLDLLKLSIIQARKPDN